MPTPKIAAPRPTASRLVGLMWNWASFLAVQERDADAADGDGGHHDLEHGEVAELEEADDHVEVGHAAAVQQEAEDESEADGGPEEFGAGEESEEGDHGMGLGWVRLGRSGRRAASR